MLNPRQETVDKRFTKKALSAIFLALTSFMITLVNKQILLEYLFPSYHFLGFCQMAMTIVALWIGRHMKLVQFPSMALGVVQRCWPLQLVLLGNFLSSIGATQELTLPMFNVLRRITLLMIIMLEQIVFGVQASSSVQAIVIAIVGGAAIAAGDDVSFSLTGFSYVILYDAFSAANGVYVKKILDSKELNAYGLLYYNSLFMFMPALFVACCLDDLDMLTRFEYWNEPLFVGYFITSCVMDVTLTYSVMLCIQYNGPLTTSILVSLKNFIFTYVAMVVLYDYTFSWSNFLGWNISVLASLAYLYVTFVKTTTYVLVDNAELRHGIDVNVS